MKILFVNGAHPDEKIGGAELQSWLLAKSLADRHSVTFLAVPIGIFLLYQFFRTVPRDLEDAAKLDGCGPLRFLIWILTPLSRPLIGALAILTFVHSWNRYMWPLIVTNSSSMRTAPIGIRMFLDETEGSHLGVMMAGAVIVIFPAIIVFIIGQKQFVRALARGAVKG